MICNSIVALWGASLAVPPNRNGLSHASKVRLAELAEKLFWVVLDPLGPLSPEFIRSKTRGRAHRFMVPIHILDKTVIELVADAMDWAIHRRCKAAAKTHLRLNR